MSTRSDAATFGPGEVLGRYMILRRLDRPGIGVVHAAWDAELERRVALKVVVDALPDEPSAKERLVDEARTLASINHRNVVAVYDVRRIEGRICIAMEHIEGTTLSDWLQRPPRPSWQVVLARLLEAGGGLAAAHAARVVHRDFKPASVLIGRVGDAGERACVTDFGLPRASIPPEESLRMAPEVRRGGELTPGADQFAFCVTAWEALFDALPFDRGSALPAAHVRVPDSVRRVLQRGLSSEPADRYRDMPHLLEDLRRAGVSNRLRNVGLVAGVAVLVGVGVYAIAGARTPRCDDGRSTWDDGWSAEDQSRLREQFEATGADYASATFDRFEHRMNTYVGGWTRARVRACGATERLQCLDRHREEALDLVRLLAEPDRRRMQSAVVEALRLRPSSECERTDARPTEHAEAVAIEEGLRGLSVRRRLAASDLHSVLGALQRRADALGDPGVLARVELQRSYIVYGEGRFDESYSICEEAAMMALAADRVDVAARALARLAVVDAQRNRLELAEHWMALAEALVERLGEVTPVHEEIAAIRARIEEISGNPLRARQAYERAVAVGTEALGRDHPVVLTTRVELARSFRYEQEFAAGLAMMEEVLATQIDLFGDVSLDVATTLEETGVMLSALGRRSEAIDRQTRAVAIRREILGHEHPEVAVGEGNLGITLLEQAEVARGLALLERATAVQSAHWGAVHINTLFLRHHLARAREASGQLEQARDEWRAVAIDLDARAEPHSVGVLVHAWLARTLAKLGQHDDAREHVARATELARTALPEGSTEAVIPVVEGAFVALRAGRPDPAPLEQVLAANSPEALQDYRARAMFYLAQIHLARTGRLAEARARADEALAHADPLVEREIKGWLADHPDE